MRTISIFWLAPFVLASFAVSATAQNQSSAGWRQTEQTDAVRGTYARFSLAGTFIKSPPGDTSDRPSLVVDCSSHNRSHTSTFVRGNLVVGDPLKIDWIEPEEIHGTSYYPKVAVRYRLNDGKEEKEEWSAGSDKTSASFTKDSLKKMLRAHSVELTAKDSSGAEIVMQFDVPDSSAIEQSCQVDDHKK